MNNNGDRPNIYLMQLCYISPLTKNKRDTDLDAMNRDHEWLSRTDLAPFSGQWIAVFERKILASDIDIEVLMKKLDAMGMRGKPLLFRVPAHPVVG